MPNPNRAARRSARASGSRSLPVVRRSSQACPSRTCKDRCHGGPGWRARRVPSHPRDGRHIYGPSSIPHFRDARWPPMNRSDLPDRTPGKHLPGRGGCSSRTASMPPAAMKPAIEMKALAPSGSPHGHCTRPKTVRFASDRDIARGLGPRPARGVGERARHRGQRNRPPSGCWAAAGAPPR